ncbi:MAG TPA: methyltransferase domain-containing protein, partial [Chloroflexota bacterium]|nr:methyltransferase domain-containing protein [Chloroflexota bacterium]
GRWLGWTERAGRGLRGRVAELGPGPGHLLARMRGGGTPAVALELSPAMAARAAARAPGAVARGDARAQPFRTQSLDALVVTFPAPYVRDPAFWREAARVLRIGGRMRVLLDAGPSYGQRGVWSIDAPTAGWRLRRARVAVGSATLGFYLARRIAPERLLRPLAPRVRRTRRRRLAPPTDFPGGASGQAQASP